jgi:hypothetical protein
MRSDAINVRGMAMAPPQTRIWWFTPPGLVLTGGLLSAAIAWWLIAIPVLTLSNVPTHSSHFPVVFAHMCGGTLMLFVGAANLYVGVTRRGFRWHKTLGYLYLAGGALGASVAVVLAVASPHEHQNAFEVSLSETTDIGYALAALGTAWLAAAAMAFRGARNRRYDAHRAWMIRSYVLVWSFVLCRLVGKFPVVADIGKGAAIIWLSWIVPLFVCEIALQWNAGRRLGSAPGISHG